MAKYGKYHSTISRRDFLKALGLGGIGLGTAALVPPLAPLVANDLDEVMASPSAQLKRPWWVKQVDKPTVDIDWDLMKRFDYSEVMWASGLKKALGPEQYNRVFQVAAANRTKWLKEDKPGFTLADVAFKEANHWAPVSYLGPQSSPTPESLGIPRYEGTPEENARLIRAFLRMHGAADVSFVELDPNTTEKLIYAYDTGFGPARGPRLDFLDVDEPEDNPEEGYRVIPRKARYVIVYTMRMADELMKRPITQIGDRAHTYMYNLKSLLQGQLQNFLRTLGYMCLGEANLFNALGTAVGFGVISGLGEQSRQGQMITPEHGLMQRLQKVITDLPLPPGKPVDFGVTNFCRTCKKCAEYCPPQAISMETEPSYDARDVPYHSPGVKNWHWPQEKCIAYIHQVGGCALCFSVCPYSKKHNTPYNDLWKASVATNPLLNRFWRQMDDSIYGDGVRDTEKFWKLELPPWGYES